MQKPKCENQTGQEVMRPAKNRSDTKAPVKLNFFHHFYTSVFEQIQRTRYNILNILKKHITNMHISQMSNYFYTIFILLGKIG